MRRVASRFARFVPPWEKAAEARQRLVDEGGFLEAMDDDASAAAPPSAEAHFAGAPQSAAEALEVVRRLRREPQGAASGGATDEPFMPYGAQAVGKVCSVTRQPAWGMYMSALGAAGGLPAGAIDKSALTPEQRAAVESAGTYSGDAAMSLLLNDNDTKLDYKYTAADAAVRPSSSSSGSVEDATQWPLHGSCGLVLDIDGVIFAGGAAIEGSASAVRHMQEVKMPFVFMTNGGGQTEAARAANLTQRLGNLLEPIRPEQVVLAHTPMSYLAEEYKGRPVLIVGPEPTSVEAARAYGFDGAVGLRDVQRAHPELVPLRRWPEADHDAVRESQRALQERLARGEATQYPQFDAIFIFNDADFDGLSDTQVILDVLTAPHGHIGAAVSKFQTVPLYMAADDLLWPAQAPLPRLGQGAIREMLASAFESVTGGELQVTMYGKPRRVNYDVALNKLQAYSASLGWEPSDLRTACMVGDNLETDIIGANARGAPWLSVHVLSGVGRAPSAVRTVTPNDDEGAWLRESVPTAPHYVAPSLDHFVREAENFGEAAVTGLRDRPDACPTEPFPEGVIEHYRVPRSNP